MSVRIIIATWLLIAACVVAVEWPRVAPNSVLRYTTVIPAEGVSIADTIVTNTDAGKQYTSHAGSNGFYAKLYRNDLGKSYYFHMIDGSLYCVMVPHNSTIFVPHMEMPYVGTTFFNGRSVNTFKYVVNKYVFTAYSDIETGHLAGYINTESMNTVHAINEYLNTSAVDDPIFEVPAACINATAQDLVSTERAPSFGSREHPLFPPREAYLVAHKRIAVSTPDAVYHPTGLPLPSSVDNAMYATPIRDQSQCGACWAFSTSALMELVRNKRWGYTTNYSAFEWYSPQSLIDCTRRMGPGDIAGPFGCQGGSPYGALLHAVSHGIPRDYNYGFTGVDGKNCRVTTENITVEYPIATARMLSSSVIQNTTAMIEAMKDAIVVHGGVVAIINEIGGTYGDVYYAGGIYNNPMCTPGLSHAVLILGYGVDAASGVKFWKIKNSFGGAWGEGGYFRMAQGVNMCGIEDFAYIATAKV